MTDKTKKTLRIAMVSIYFAWIVVYLLAVLLNYGLIAENLKRIAPQGSLFPVALIIIAMSEFMNFSELKKSKK